MNRIVFLCSGAGGNFHFIRTAITNGLLPDWEISAVIVDRDCDVFSWCRASGQSAKVLDFEPSKQSPTVLDELRRNDPAIIVTNIHKIIAPEIVDHFAGRMINVHYSLLPAFGGLIGSAPVAAALDDRRALLGCTVHHVTSEVDAGPAIAQIAFPALDDRAVDDLMNPMFRAGAIALVASISAFSGDRPGNVAEVLTLDDRIGLYCGPAFDFGKIEDGIWTAVRDATRE
ncbi:MAG: phosphoribosylglycinamide formyltransferase [Boseongicola sp.]